MTYTELTKSAPAVLVEFYASWCPHCRKMMPIVEELKELLSGQVEVYQLEIDDNRDAADEAGVQSIPTFILYRNGEEAWRQSGEMEGDFLLSNIQSKL